MLDINQVSRASGLPASAIRFYEEKGLIKSVGRKGLKRLFPDGILDELAFISLAQEAGFKLTEIKRLVLQSSKLDRSLLRQKATELDQKIKKMMMVKKGLLHAAECTAPSHFECPKFKRLLRLSSRNSSKSRSNAKNVPKR